VLSFAALGSPLDPSALFLKKKKLLLSLESNYISLPSALFGISLATKILESLQLALKDTKLSQSVHTSPKSQWQPVSSNV